METRLSTKGQVVLPKLIRRKLDLRPGDPLDAKLEGKSIVLTPCSPRVRKGKIVRDKVTGLPILTSGKNAPVLTSRQVRDILANFP
jgi:AbrB family looped-hinge helix DNA binding protein